MQVVQARRRGLHLPLQSGAAPDSGQGRSGAKQGCESAFLARPASASAARPRSPAKPRPGRLAQRRRSLPGKPAAGVALPLQRRPGPALPGNQRSGRAALLPPPKLQFARVQPPRKALPIASRGARGRLRQACPRSAGRVRARGHERRPPSLQRSGQHLLCSQPGAPAHWSPGRVNFPRSRRRAPPPSFRERVSLCAPPPPPRRASSGAARAPREGQSERASERAAAGGRGARARRPRAGAEQRGARQRLGRAPRGGRSRSPPTPARRRDAPPPGTPRRAAMRRRRAQLGRASPCRGEPAGVGRAAGAAPERPSLPPLGSPAPRRGGAPAPDLAPPPPPRRSRPGLP